MLYDEDRGKSELMGGPSVLGAPLGAEAASFSSFDPPRTISSIHNLTVAKLIGYVQGIVISS
jgi:hypothetical protein